MNYIIKQATAAHIKEIAVQFNLYRQFYKQASEIAKSEAFLTERVTNNESVIFFALSEKEEVMGFTQLYPSFSSVSMQHIWILNDLFVNDKFRKMGVGRALMETAMGLGLSTGARRIGLQTAISNASAQVLYESLGWKKDNDYYYYNWTVQNTST
jgi:GNAT superfamily N-acetyltransferase